MTQSKVIDFINNNPALTYEGIEWNLKNPNYRKNRASLLNAKDEITKCVWWLKMFYQPNLTMRNLSSSYGLKHYVEKFCDSYVSNGSFVTAVKYLGYEYRQYKDDPNIYLPFSKKKLKEYRKKYLNL